MSRSSNIPIYTVTLDDVVYYMGFRVVTEKLKSLGLARNPHIIQYPVNEWYFLPPEQIREGPDSFGGIWVARTFLSGAKNVIRNLKRRKKPYTNGTRIFRAAIGAILYYNVYRIKTNGIFMFEEVHLDCSERLFEVEHSACDLYETL